MPAIVGKADSYVELPWMAFAAGAAFAAFVIADALRPHWTLSYTALLHATVILSAGGASVLLVIFAPPYARLFLRPSQVDIEVRQYVYLLGTYLIGYPLAKFRLQHMPWYVKAAADLKSKGTATIGGFTVTSGSSGGSGSSWSSSGSSFSGGGGSSGGGGASGSW